MDKFDVVFKTRSSLSEFACYDGEIESLSGGKNQLPDVWTDETLTPPPPDVDFAIVRDTLKGWHLIPDDFPSKTIPASSPSMEYWNSMAAQLLSHFVSEASNRGLLVAPFYAMAAWRGTDGRFLSCSKPARLTPNSKVPLVGSFGDISESELEFKIAAALGGLNLRMRAPELLRDFVGIIESLTVFVSQPLHSYDSYHALIPGKRCSTDSYCECLDKETGEISRQTVCTTVMPIGWSANLKEIRMESTHNGLTYYPIGAIPLGEVDLWEEWRDIPVSLDDEAKAGIQYGKIGEAVGESKSKETVVEGRGDAIKVLTRPIKLSGAGMLKTIRRVYLRGKYTPSLITITVLGSRDMLKWWKISQRKGGTVVALPGSPMRFYKIQIEGYLAEGENLQGLTLL